MDTSQVKVDFVKAKKDKRIKKINRPIIIVTNNLYSKHITKLWEIALTIKLRPSLDDQKYETWLKSICMKEKLAIAVGTIRDLL